MKPFLLLLCLSSVASAQTYTYYEKTTRPAGGYTLNIKDYARSVGTGADDTTAFNSAVTKALTFTIPVTIYLPCGSYKLSSAVAITLPVSTTNGVYVKGENTGCVTITQTGDANGFTVQINNFGPSLFSSGAIGFSGFTLAMTGASTAKVGISVTTSASSGAQGIPLYIDHINFTSVDASHYWGTEMSINEVTGFTIEKINGTYPAAAVGTHLSIQGNSTSYSAAGTIRDLYFINGTGLVLGDYIQGLIAERLNFHSLAAGYAIYSAPANGANLGIQFLDSYILGRVYFNPTGAATFSSIVFSNNYFDALGTVIPSADNLVAINNVLRLALNNNYYSCVGGSANITGLSLTGTIVPASISNEQIVSCPVGMATNLTTYPIHPNNVQFRPQNAAFVNVVDTSSGVPNLFGADLSIGNNAGVEQYQFPAWTTGGIIMGGVASTITDTTTASNIAEEVLAAIPQETLTLSTGHTATITGVASLYVPPPLCSNVGGGTLTCTNLYSIDAPGIIRSTSGGLQSTGGGAIQGAAVSLNASSNNNVNINTGTSTGTVTLGNTAGTGAAVTVSAPTTFGFGTSLSQATWGLTGIGIIGSAATFNDTTVGSGGVANDVAYAFASPTFTNTQGTANVLTSATTAYFGIPVCGSGWTSCTNLFGLQSNGGIRSTGGGGVQSTAGATLQGGSVSLNASSNNTTNINTGNSNGAVHIGDGSGNNAITVGNGTGLVNMTNMENAAGTTFTLGNFSGCSTTNGTPTTLTGGSQTGSFVTASSGTTCSVLITPNGATGATAAHGWYCAGADVTSGVALVQTTKSTTQCTLKGTINATTDVVVWHGYAY